MSDVKPLTEAECAKWGAMSKSVTAGMWSDVSMLRALATIADRDATIADLRAKLAEAERERDEAAAGESARAVERDAAQADARALRKALEGARSHMVHRGYCTLASGWNYSGDPEVDAELKCSCDAGVAFEAVERALRGKEAAPPRPAISFDEASGIWRGKEAPRG